MDVNILKKTAAASNSSAPTNIQCGVSWDVSGGNNKGLLGRLARARGVDLDVAALFFGADGKPVRACYYNNLTPFPGVVHSGDNRSGKGDGIDESITIDLLALPDSIRYVVFAVTSFKGATFDRVNNLDVVFSDASTGAAPFHKEFIAVEANKNAAVVAILYRDAGGVWDLDTSTHLSYIEADELVSSVNWQSLVPLASRLVNQRRTSR